MDSFVSVRLVLSIVQILSRDDSFALVEELRISLQRPLGINRLRLCCVRLGLCLLPLRVGLDPLRVALAQLGSGLFPVGASLSERYLVVFRIELGNSLPLFY